MLPWGNKARSHIEKERMELSCRRQMIKRTIKNHCYQDIQKLLKILQGLQKIHLEIKSRTFLLHLCSYDIKYPFRYFFPRVHALILARVESKLSNHHHFQSHSALAVVQEVAGNSGFQMNTEDTADQISSFSLLALRVTDNLEHLISTLGRSYGSK